MTPSEIADWLEGLASSQRAAAQAAALANVRGRWQEHLESLAKGCERAAATIRAQAEALKIATEALGEISRQGGEINPSNYDHDDACNLNDRFVESVFIAEKALARIKVVG